MKKLLILTLFLINLIGLGATNSEIIAQIRKEYAKTNAEKNYKVEKQSLDVLTTEGGERIIYSKNGEVKKIIIVYYGETGKRIDEFYMKNNKPYFLLSTTFYYDMTQSALADDSVSISDIEIKIRKKESERYYFNPQGTLIRYIGKNNKIIEDRKTLRNLEKKIENPMSHKVMKDVDLVK